MPGSAGGGHSSGGHSSGGHSGSFGGGHSSGGSRSSGGFSSGSSGRSGGHSGTFGSGHSSSSGSRSTGGYSGYSGYRRTGSSGGYRRVRSGGGYRGGGSTNSGCLSGLGRVFLLPIVLVFVVLVGVIAVFENIAGTGHDTGTYEQIQVREKLPESKCTAKYPCIETDLSNRLDQKELTECMDYFYENTGVQPYFILLGGIDGESDPDYDKVDTYLYNKYVDTFGKDEGHLIILMLVDDNTYVTYYIIGDDAVTVTDESACEMLLDEIDYYAEETDDITDIMKKAFVSAADEVLYDYEYHNDTRDLIVKIVMVGGVVLMAVLLVVYLAKKKKAETAKVNQVLVQNGAPTGDSFGDFAPQQQRQYQQPQQTYQQQPYQQQPQQKAKYPVRCPYCGATAYPKEDGTCEYCGMRIGQ